MNKDFDAQKYMEMAIEEMKKSVSEPRDDKVSPKVGAILIKPDGTVEKAHRGELRYGDHAEFTLLERKNRSESLDGSLLFATLEPCAPGARNHPKLSCAERIVLARLKKVWIGIEDPDPTVDRYGIKYLQDHGIETDMFDADLQDIIRKENKSFLKGAEERAKQAESEQKEQKLSDKEEPETKAELNDFDKEQVDRFIQKANLQVEFGDEDFVNKFQKMGLVALNDDKWRPTGIGLILLGAEPQLLHQNAQIRATYSDTNGREELENFVGPIVTQTDQEINWFKLIIANYTTRTVS